MRRRVLAMAVVLLLCVAAPARAAYDHASGGAATPSAIAADGGTDYSVSLTGRQAVVDIVLVLDNSGSMSGPYTGSGSKWAALASDAKSFVSNLSGEGFFARGGKVGVVRFADATAALAPTADTSAIATAIDEGAPSGNSCIGCGLQRAAELLAVGPAGHRRLIYLFADGENTVTPPTLSEAVAAANAAGATRRVIGIGSGAEGKGLEALDSDGTVPYPTSVSALADAIAAEPTNLPGATNLSWAFHLTPGFTASAPTASKGAVSVNGQDVTWSIPSLGEETATLAFHADHAASSGCAATALLTGTTFGDSEGDAAPAVSLGPLSLSGCPPPSGGSPGAGAAGPAAKNPHLQPGSDLRSVISLPKASPKCSPRNSLTVTVKPPKGESVRKVGGKAKTYRGRQGEGKIKVAPLPTGKYTLTVTVTLASGRSVTLARSYRKCPEPRTP